MVEVLTQESAGGNDGGTHPGMSWWVWWNYSAMDELVGTVEVLTQESVGGNDGGTHPLIELVGMVRVLT